MRRIYAFAIGLVLLMATPGLATADISAASRQEAIKLVITRALSQRGVPYVYGGGNAAGPTPGVVQAAPMVPQVLTLGADPGLSAPAVPSPSPVAAPRANTVGFDSSGLVQYAFAGVGIKLPRSSGEQYKVGRKVLPAQALPGDLIFYGPEGTQSVALFLGNGQMIEGTEPAVTVSPVRTAGMTPYLTRLIDA